MPTIIQKYTTLLNANLHSLIDHTLDVKSLKSADQYINQIEHSFDVLTESSDTVNQSAQELKYKYEEFLKQVEQEGDYRHKIDKLISRQSDDLGAWTGYELNTKYELAQDYYEQWQFQKEQCIQILELRTNLQHRLKIVVQIREELYSLLQSDDNPTLDNAINALYKKADQEDMRVKQLNRESETKISRLPDKIELNLEERKRRLLGKDSDD